MSFLQQHHIVALTRAMNHALRAHWWLVAVVAVVGNFLLGVISAQLSHVAVRLVHHGLMLLLLRALTTAWSTCAARVNVSSRASPAETLLRLRGNSPRQVSIGHARVLVHARLPMLLKLLLAINLASNLQKLSRAFRVQDCCTLAELADHRFESVLILGGLLLQVQGGALQTQVVIASQDQNIFWLLSALGTADVVFLVLVVRVILLVHGISIRWMALRARELRCVMVIAHLFLSCCCAVMEILASNLNLIC